MDESASDSLSAPGWIWIVALLMVIGVVVVFIIKYEKHNDSADSDPHGRHRQRSNQHRRRHRRRHRGSDRDDASK